jgi:phosphopentomutase
MTTQILKSWLKAQHHLNTTALSIISQLSVTTNTRIIMNQEIISSNVIRTLKSPKIKINLTIVSTVATTTIKIIKTNIRTRIEEIIRLAQILTNVTMTMRMIEKSSFRMVAVRSGLVSQNYMTS